MAGAPSLVGEPPAPAGLPGVFRIITQEIQTHMPLPSWKAFSLSYHDSLGPPGLSVFRPLEEAAVQQEGRIKHEGRGGVWLVVVVEVEEEVAPAADSCGPAGGSSASVVVVAAASSPPSIQKAPPRCGACI